MLFITLIFILLTTPVFAQSQSTNNDLAKYKTGFASIHTPEQLKDENFQILEDYEKTIWKNRYENPVVAFETTQKALKLAEKIKSYQDLAFLYNYLGIILMQFDFYEQSLEYFSQALDIAIKHDVIREKGFGYENIGHVFMRMGEYDSATVYIFKALDIFTSINNIRGAAYSYMRAGDICIAQKKYEESIRYYKKAVELNNMEHVPYSTIYPAYKNIINADINIGNLKEAEQFLYYTKLQAEKIGSEYQLAQYYISQSKLTNQKGNLNDAMLLLDSALNVLNHEKYYELKVEIFSQKAQLADMLENSSSLTIKNYRQILAYKDSAETIGKSVSNAQYKMRSQISKLNRELHINQMKIITERRNLHIKYATIAIILGIIGLIIMFFTIKKLSKKLADGKIENIANDYDQKISTIKQSLSQEKESNRYTQIKMSETNFITDRIVNYVINEVQYPLQNIALATQEKNVNPKETLAKIYNIATKSYEQYDNIIKLIRFQSGQFNVKLEPINLHSLVTKIIYQFQGDTVRKYIDLKANVNENISVISDKFILGIIIKNLLSNAIHQAEPQSEIILSCIETEQETKIYIEGQQENPQIPDPIDDIETSLDFLLCRQLASLIKADFSPAGKPKSKLFALKFLNTNNL